MSSSIFITSSLQFAAIPDAIFFADVRPDTRLVLAYLISRPAGHEIKIGEMLKQLHITDFSWRHIRKELAAFGFSQQTGNDDRGQIRTRTTFDPQAALVALGVTKTKAKPRGKPAMKGKIKDLMGKAPWPSGQQVPLRWIDEAIAHHGQRHAKAIHGLAEAFPDFAVNAGENQHWKGVFLKQVEQKCGA